MTITTGNEGGDAVNHPSHYNQHPSGIECVEIARHFNFDVGNAIKYLWRAGLKTDLTEDELAAELRDTEKAIWYLQDHAEELRRRQLLPMVSMPIFKPAEGAALLPHVYVGKPTESNSCANCGVKRNSPIHQSGAQCDHPYEYTAPGKPFPSHYPPDNDPFHPCEKCGWPQTDLAHDDPIEVGS